MISEISALSNLEIGQIRRSYAGNSNNTMLLWFLYPAKMMRKTVEKFHPRTKNRFFEKNLTRKVDVLHDVSERFAVDMSCVHARTGVATVGTPVFMKDGQGVGERVYRVANVPQMFRSWNTIFLSSSDIVLDNPEQGRARSVSRFIFDSLRMADDNVRKMGRWQCPQKWAQNGNGVSVC